MQTRTLPWPELAVSKSKRRVVYVYAYSKNRLSPRQPDGAGRTTAEIAANGVLRLFGLSTVCLKGITCPAGTSQSSFLGTLDRVRERHLAVFAGEKSFFGGGDEIVPRT